MMKGSPVIVLLATLAALGTAACDEMADELTGEGLRGGEDGENAQGGYSAALECTEAPVGRSYVGFDGNKLEDSRLNEGVGVNRARVKPYTSLEKEYVRVLGIAPAGIKDSSGSFEQPATRWFGETLYSGVSLHAIATLSYDVCLDYAKGQGGMSAAPTTETATAECTKLMRKAWSRSPSPEEVGKCVDLAVTKLADEKDVGRRWAYACASVLTATQFLTF